MFLFGEHFLLSISPVSDDNRLGEHACRLSWPEWSSRPTWPKKISSTIPTLCLRSSQFLLR
jgi:hypothetical protein